MLNNFVSVETYRVYLVMYLLRFAATCKQWASHPQLWQMYQYEELTSLCT